MAAEAGIEVLTNAVVLGRYDGNWIAVLDRGPGTAGAGAERLVKARAKTLVVAPGLIERPYVIEGNDLPGVMLSTAVRRLINLYAVKPGERAVVLTANADGDAAVADLKRAGVEVARVEDSPPRRRRDGRQGTRRGPGGRGQLTARRSTVTCWSPPSAGPPRPHCSMPPVTGPSTTRELRGSSRTRHGCPRTCSSPAASPATAGSTSSPSTPAPPAPRRPAAPRISPGPARWPRPPGRCPGTIREPGRSPVPIPELPVYPHPELFAGRTHGFVDFSEDVSSKDLEAAVAEGYDSAELAKRFTTATMGPVQGKLETVNTVAVVARATGSSIAETGTTTWRPPYVPVTLGALAGQAFEPVRYSPMQPWHEAHGAVPLIAGAWIRPDGYGDPAAEARNVRENVGIIDVTPIGKLDLRGPDIPRLLNLLYVNKWSKLEIGRVRYGVMCAEDGVVLDDGVTGRLGDEHYLMSTTSSGAATVWEWAENWLQTEHPDWRVHVTPVTTAYASMNVAGPKSRQLIERVTEGVDLANEAFPYMHVRTGTIAGVSDSVLWRIGFTGELSYELHVPAGYGLHVWETLLAAGADLGVAPFGVEAQRILRLEKGHFIVGQDTDGLTRAFSAGLDWAIKLDKDDFAGKPELAWQLAQGIGAKLVGLQPVDPSVVPEEASLVMDGETIAGRITSSRMSPTLRRSICLAQVDARLAEPGTVVTVRLPDGRLIAARVTPQHAHVDPDGGRMRV